MPVDCLLMLLDVYRTKETLVEMYQNRGTYSIVIRSFLRLSSFVVPVTQNLSRNRRLSQQEL